VAAAADPAAALRGAFRRDHGGRAFASVEELAACQDIDVVWVATPTWLHRHHVEVVAAAGKNIVVEKPMAVSLVDCDAMIDAARAASVHLLAGGVRSLDPGFQAMARVVTDGSIGDLKAIQTAVFTGWMRRTRTAADLDPAQGGGMLINQAPHQVDVVRLLAAGAEVASVFARAGDWSKTYPGVGYYVADLELGNGVFATVTYDGYGHIAATEVVPHASCPRCAVQEPWVPTDAGRVVAVCTGGEVRQGPHGLEVFGENGMHEVSLPPGDVNTTAVDQLIAARDHAVPIHHSGEWGRATHAAVLALAASAELGIRIDVPNAVLHSKMNENRVPL